jgi:hypothetical protein
MRDDPSDVSLAGACRKRRRRADDDWAPSAGLSAAELAARLQFLERRLDAGRPTALAWEWGWTAIYTATFARNLSDAINADEGDNRVRAIVDAAKSGLATIQTGLLLQDPLSARLGAQPMRDVPGDDRSARLQRLAVGEKQLLTAAERAESRYSLRRHLITIGTNLLGGAAILALGDKIDAARSTAIGIALGEVQIWSQPWRAPGDLRDYDATFPSGRGITWALGPMGTGVQLAIRF